MTNKPHALNDVKHIIVSTACLRSAEGHKYTKQPNPSDLGIVHVYIVLHASSTTTTTTMLLGRTKVMPASVGVASFQCHPIRLRRFAVRTYCTCSCLCAPVLCALRCRQTSLMQACKMRQCARVTRVARYSGDGQSAFGIFVKLPA